MHLGTYLGLVHDAADTLARVFRDVGTGHADEPDVALARRLVAELCAAHIAAMNPARDRYHQHREAEPGRLYTQATSGSRSGTIELIRDRQDVHPLAGFVDTASMVVHQAGQGMRDHKSLDIVGACQQETEMHLRWLTTSVKQAAPQILIAAR